MSFRLLLLDREQPAARCTYCMRLLSVFMAHVKQQILQRRFFSV